MAIILEVEVMKGNHSGTFLELLNNVGGNGRDVDGKKMITFFGAFNPSDVYTQIIRFGYSIPKSSIAIKNEVLE